MFEKAWNWDGRPRAIALVETLMELEMAGMLLVLLMVNDLGVKNLVNDSVGN